MKRGTYEHPKTLALQSMLALDDLQIGGLLERLTAFVRDYAPQGDIGKWTDEQIARGLKWIRADHAELVDALVACKWLDHDDVHRLLVHDWPDHADDTTHRYLARQGLLFANGAKPKTSRLTREERALADERLAKRAHGGRPKGARSTPAGAKWGGTQARPGQARPGVCAAAPPPPPATISDENPSAQNGNVERPWGVYSTRCAMPEDLEPNAEALADAVALGCKDPARAFAKFKAYHVGRALERLSWSHRWDLKWRSWILSHDERGCPCRVGLARGDTPLRDTTGIVASILGAPARKRVVEGVA